MAAPVTAAFEVTGAWRPGAGPVPPSTDDTRGEWP